MNSRFAAVLTLILAHLCLPSFAITALNTANIALPTHTDQSQLEPLFETGLKQVLIKISGDQKITSMPYIKSILKNAQNWVSSYHYTTLDNKQILSVSFNATSITTLLKAHGQTVWSNHRPLTLVWISTPKDSPATVHSNPNLLNAATQSAQTRGLNILLPKLNYDQAPISNLQLLDENNGAPDALTLMNNYHAEAILFGTLVKSAQQDTIYWKFTSPARTIQWSNSALSDTDTVRQGINQLADTLIDSSVSNNKLERNYLLTVNNIKATRTIKKLIEQLNDSNIGQCRVTTLQNSSATLLITSALDTEALTTHLNNIPYLQQSNNTTATQNSSELTFDWVN